MGYKHVSTCTINSTMHLMFDCCTKFIVHVSTTSNNFIRLLKLILYSLTAALQSVFPQTELGTFMALSIPDKEKQLVELSRIVTGIRLFNKDCGKGGEGIDDCKNRIHVHVQDETLLSIGFARNLINKNNNDYKSNAKNF